MFNKSIRWRLQLWLGFLLLCVLSGFGVTAYQLQRINRISQIDEDLARRVSALNSEVRRPPFPLPPDRPRFESGPGRGPWERRGPDGRGPRGRREDFLDTREIVLSPQTASLFERAETNDFYFAIWSRTGALLKQSTNAPAGVLLPERPDGDTRIHARMRDTNREAYQFTEIGECVMAGRSIDFDLRAMWQFAGWLVAVGVSVLALGLGGGWLLAGRALRPVEEIGAAASRISAGNLAERINVAETDSELGRLAGVLNSTFARLEAAFAQQKQFTADASHELRTPLAVIISEAQTTLARERGAAEYRETVEVRLDTAQEMRALTDSLLELARLDSGQEQIQRNPLDLAEMTSAAVERIRPLAAGSCIQIDCDLSPARALGNADRLAQVVTNLLTNAIHYNKPNGEIRVSTRTEGAAPVLIVADTGPGIAAEDLPHIFERFYRADESRSGAGGRSGLGLAICKAIVDAHGGTIEVSSQPGVGTTFTVRLPVDQ